MSTSGTLSSTVIDTAILIEHMVRRAGIPASKQTPELINAASESLYILLLGLSNKGLNLWCVDRFYQGLIPGQATYVMPAGSLNIINVVFSKPQLVTTTDSHPTSKVSQAAFTSSAVTRVGINFSAVTTSDTLTLEASADGLTWVTVDTQTGDLVNGTTLWFDVTPIANYTQLRVTTLQNSQAVLYPASSVYDLPMTPWSRDTYMAINNKTNQATTSTNYFLERKLLPQLTLWPVPESNTDHLSLVRHRQIQDIGSLSQQIEIPQRWLESITWQGAFRVAAEADGVDPSRLTLCKQMSDEMTVEVEQDESDNAPISMLPNIGVYTR